MTAIPRWFAEYLLAAAGLMRLSRRADGDYPEPVLTVPPGSEVLLRLGGRAFRVLVRSGSEAVVEEIPERPAR